MYKKVTVVLRVLSMMREKSHLIVAKITASLTLAFSARDSRDTRPPPPVCPRSSLRCWQIPGFHLGIFQEEGKVTNSEEGENM